MLSFKLAANNRKILEAAFPPERFTLPGRDPKKEYDAIEAYLKTYSDQTIRNIFWSGNNYVLPKTPAKIGTKITYWYGDEEKKDRRSRYPLHQALFSAGTYPRHPEDGARRACDDLPRGVLPLFR